MCVDLRRVHRGPLLPLSLYGVHPFRVVRRGCFTELGEELGEADDVLVLKGESAHQPRKLAAVEGTAHQGHKDAEQGVPGNKKLQVGFKGTYSIVGIPLMLNAEGTNYWNESADQGAYARKSQRLTETGIPLLWWLFYPWLQLSAQQVMEI